MAKAPVPPCPNAANHTPSPTGYPAHSEWAEDAAIVAVQTKCDGCGNQTDLRNLYGPTVQARAVGISSVNTLRLTEHMANYGMAHSDCPPPK